jgi:hypothetical protein
MCHAGEFSAKELVCGHCEEANKVCLRDESQDVMEIGGCPMQRWGYILGQYHG